MIDSAHSPTVLIVLIFERMYNKLDGLSARRITYTYNRLGELTYRHMSGNTHRWWYTYNALGQLKLVRSNTSTDQITDADYSAYWPAGMVQTEVLGNQTISFIYDARDRILGINDVTSTSHKFSAKYTWLANGNVNAAEYHQPSFPHSHTRYRYTHTYDNRNQLKSATYNWWNGSSWQNPSSYDVSGITYDKDGNLNGLTRRTQTGSANTYSYQYVSSTNKLNKIVKNSTDINFSHDANGNATAIGGSYNITATTYDWRNLPLSITKGSTTYNYRYDHAGLRVYSSDNQTFTIRGAFGEVLAVYDYDEIEEKIELNYWNILRPDGTVIGRRKGSSRLYYIRDHLGSTRSIVDASGSVVQTYDYYPFGLEMPGRSLTSGPTARERFTGHERDEEVGLDYMQARRFAAEFGRFLSVDPLADEFAGWTPYHYVHNNPLRFIDPSGMSACESESGQSMCVDNEMYDWALDLFEDKGLFGRVMNYLFSTDPEIGSFEFNEGDYRDAVAVGIMEDINNVARETVHLGIEVADGVSFAADAALPVAFVAGPKAIGALGFVGTAADATSTVLKGADYIFFDGSQKAFEAQVKNSMFNFGKVDLLKRVR